MRRALPAPRLRPWLPLPLPRPLLLLLALPGLLSCGPPRQALNDERQRRIRAEAWIRKAEAALGSCRRHATGLEGRERQHEQRVRSLQQELARVRQALTRCQRDGEQCRRQVGAQAAAQNATRGVVLVRETRRFKGTVTAIWRKRLEGLRGALQACYRSQVLPRHPGFGATGWLILELGPQGLVSFDISAPGSRVRSMLWGCVQRALGGGRLLRAPGYLRFAQLLVFAPDPQRLPQGAVPALRWPPRSVGPGTSRAGQVCRYSTHRGRGVDHRIGQIPFLSRPCAPGLKCCYPCGIPGCNSVCMKDCGPPRP